jgi:hypothetical protein
MSQAEDTTPDDEPNPDCEMPNCVGSTEDETKAARDPSENVIDICESCLADGWGSVVEVLE